MEQFEDLYFEFKFCFTLITTGTKRYLDLVGLTDYANESMRSVGASNHEQHWSELKLSNRKFVYWMSRSPIWMLHCALNYEAS